MKLEDNMVSDTNQSQEDQHCMIPLICGSSVVRSQRQTVEWWVPEAEGRDKGELVFIGTEVQFCTMKGF